ncbi:hypothetical protein GCM10027395_26250 [Giesbergeria sinuosa]
MPHDAVQMMSPTLRHGIKTPHCNASMFMYAIFAIQPKKVVENGINAYGANAEADLMQVPVSAIQNKTVMT